MLNHLSIKNVAVIDELEVSFYDGMSVLTGETGAGKSIIIDSINMILGDRANKELVRFGEEKAVVQAVFDANKAAMKILEENDIEAEDNQIIITRKITKDGKSTARINGIVVTLNTLRELSDCLINIHGQHDNQALLNPRKHINFLDDYAGDLETLDEYKALYRKMKAVERDIKSLEMDEKEKIQRIDLLEYQIKEIESANLTCGEEEELKTQRDIISNAEKIKSAAASAYEKLYESSDTLSAYDNLSMAANELAEIAELNPAVKSVYDVVSEAVYSIEDASGELKSFADTVDFDEKAFDETEERLDLISKLKRKYGSTIEAVLEYLSKIKSELNDIRLSNEKTAELQSELTKITAKLKAASERLTAIRRKSAEELQNKIEQSLRELNMEKARFCVEVKDSGAYTENGADNVEFLISANPGEPLKPLVKIASGGELSRVMLAIKSIIADTDDVETLIFDEIDTGVSGNAALKIAKMLAKIGRKKQVVCITHLPQLASAANTHYLILKNTEGELASTTLAELDQNGRETELARIIDGGDISKTALSHAREMLRNASLHF